MQALLTQDLAAKDKLRAQKEREDAGIATPAERKAAKLSVAAKADAPAGEGTDDHASSQAEAGDGADDDSQASQAAGAGPKAKKVCACAACQALSLLRLQACFEHATLAIHATLAGHCCVICQQATFTPLFDVVVHGMRRQTASAAR